MAGYLSNLVSALQTDAQGSFSVKIPLTSFRTHDALATNLPGTAGNDDLGLTTGTFLTSKNEIVSGDAATSTLTRHAAALVTVPENYQDGSALTLSVDWTRDDAAAVSATLDAQVARTVAPTTDICATAAQNINAAASGTADFTLTPTSVVAGEELHIKLTIAADDTAGANTDHAIIAVSLDYTV